MQGKAPSERKFDRALIKALLAIVFITAPQIISAWWYMFSSTPPYQWFKENGWPTVSFSPLWITGPIGVVFLMLIWNNTRRLKVDFVKIFEDALSERKHVHDVKILMIGHAERSAFYTVRIVNRGANEERVRAVKFFVVHMSGEPEGIDIRTLRGCGSLPYAMPPRSSFEVEFKTSINGMTSYNWTKDARPGMRIKEYYATVEFEIGTSIESERIPVTFVPPAIRPTGDIKGAPVSSPPVATVQKRGSTKEKFLDTITRANKQMEEMRNSDTFKRTMEIADKSTRSMREMWETDYSIRIISAKYGADKDGESKWKNVTDAVQRSVTDNGGAVTANTLVLGVDDPIYLARKTLIVNYSINGREMTVSIPENETKNLRSPNQMETEAAKRLRGEKEGRDLYERCVTELRNKKLPVEALINAGAAELSTNDDLVRLVAELEKFGFANPFGGVLEALPKDQWLQYLAIMKRTNLDFSSETAFEESFLKAALFAPPSPALSN